jgi:phage terminase large subunit-like protein
MPKHPADQYVDDVMEGKVAACKWVVKACERHLNDLDFGHQRGLYFDAAAGQHILDFFQFLRHSKGRWAGQVMVLEPWQQFILRTLFGWKRADGTRRFRTAYLEVARKNGKSTLLSGVGLYLLDADGEAGAEIFTAAVKRDQARITHGEATRMVKTSPSLRKRLKVVKDNIFIAGTAAKFEPLGRDADSMDGLNVHGAIIDELHAHKTRDVWDILATATGAREQPLIVAITTAGFNRQTVCFEQHELVTKILDGTADNDDVFGIIYSIDEGDDWQDERVWIKANPNLGVSVKLEDLRAQAKLAQQIPAQLNAFLRLKLDVWTTSSSKWIDITKWEACNAPVDADGLRGRRCYGGLDLSTSTDISALVLVFPPVVDGEPHQVLCRFWVPEESMRERSKKDGVPYESWVRQGWLKATPGNVIDFRFITEEIRELADTYDIAEIAFDPWNATQTSTELASDGLTMVQMRQGFQSLSAPTKMLETLILSKTIAHGGNVPLSWMVANTVTEEDAAGNLKPSKAKSTERIDGTVALIMAISRAVLNAGDNGPSVYEDRGVLSLD